MECDAGNESVALIYGRYGKQEGLLLLCHHCHSFELEVDNVLAADVDDDLLDGAAGEVEWRLVVVANNIRGLMADGKTFACDSKFAGLCADLALTDLFFVDVELEIAVGDE